MLSRSDEEEVMLESIPMISFDEQGIETGRVIQVDGVLLSVEPGGEPVEIGAPESVDVVEPYITTTFIEPD